MKFTPGPWKLLNDLTIRVKNWKNNNQMGDYQGCIIADLKPALGADENFTLENKKPCREHALPETIANANLISAAPELYQMLEELIETAEELRAGDACDHSVGICWCGYFSTLHHAEKALKKARGEQ